jgi:serine phosphatase RsbU (regulator of sigma subunit)
MSGPVGTAAVRRRECISWAVASMPFKNERESGDRYVFHPSGGGFLIAAIDGTGHGAEAATAAKIAVATLEAHALESPIGLLLRCHQELKGTRGAVITTAFVHLSDETLTWAGVGNVEAMLYHCANPHVEKPARLVLRNGVLGYRLPPVQAEVLPLKPLDTLILFTDGIDPDFDERLCLDDDPKAIADDILHNHHTGNDDALVLVARYMGGECERTPA